MTEKKDLVLEILGIIQDQLVEMRAEMATKADIDALKADMERKIDVLKAHVTRLDQRITTFTLSHRVEVATRAASLSERMDELEARLGKLEQADSEP